MSTLSNAEKQKLLRERRQAKMKANGGDRLNKITSSNSSFASTSTPLQKSETTTNSNTENVIPEKVAKTASTGNTRSNRISSILDNPPPSLLNLKDEFDSKSSAIQEEDPDVADIDEIDIIRNKAFNALSGADKKGTSSNSAGSFPLQGDDIFSQNDFMKSFLGGSNLGGSPGDSTQDLFGKLMSNPDMANMFGGDGSIPSGGQSTAPSTIAYDSYRSSQFKAWYLVFRMLSLMAISIYSFFTLQIRFYFVESSTNDRYFLDDTNTFKKLFIAMETVSLCYFIQYLNSIDYQFQYDSIIPQFVISTGQMFLPSKLISTANAANKYYQVFKFFSTDVAIVVLALTLLSLIF
ncbi:hypothetical protein DASC09_033740 [Saccharomycopsis crataegensis]|uniref:Golgi to ER traffic protein 2 n=1 Tax=Saccharomycopsis crataegensis TaxID=43959 RepID=A0AAV5QN08_9ASCO|nr:hypothetical protein DASC09_033740 [Saccharomycopsis crataegensis]